MPVLRPTATLSTPFLIATWVTQEDSAELAEQAGLWRSSYSISMIWPELTTIRQPMSDLSGAAADLLVRKSRARQSGKKEESRHEMLDFTLIRRQSDATPQVR